MFESCIQKQNQIRSLFNALPSEDLKYQKIIELGRELTSLSLDDKIPENIVKGCQSTMYLRSELSNGVVIFDAESDALISAGLAAILIKVYSGEKPETILKCPPDFLEDLGISASLTPNRANGLYSIHLRMKQDALKLFMQT
ncbi:MAG: SufE family protein [Parachlamydiaceae bacterium]|nr:SufE family protein [Parachlamydiaceae bacterium]